MPTQHPWPEVLTWTAVDGFSDPGPGVSSGVWDASNQFTQDFTISFVTPQLGHDAHITVYRSQYRRMGAIPIGGIKAVSLDLDSIAGFITREDPGGPATFGPDGLPLSGRLPIAALANIIGMVNSATFPPIDGFILEGSGSFGQPLTKLTNVIDFVLNNLKNGGTHFLPLDNDGMGGPTGPDRWPQKGRLIRAVCAAYVSIELDVCNRPNVLLGDGFFTAHQNFYPPPTESVRDLQEVYNGIPLEFYGGQSWRLLQLPFFAPYAAGGIDTDTGILGGLPTLYQLFGTLPGPPFPDDIVELTLQVSCDGVWPS